MNNEELENVYADFEEKLRNQLNDFLGDNVFEKNDKRIELLTKFAKGEYIVVNNDSNEQQ